MRRKGLVNISEQTNFLFCEQKKNNTMQKLLTTLLLLSLAGQVISDSCLLSTNSTCSGSLQRNPATSSSVSSQLASLYTQTFGSTYNWNNNFSFSGDQLSASFSYIVMDPVYDSSKRAEILGINNQVISGICNSGNSTVAVEVLFSAYCFPSPSPSPSGTPSPSSTGSPSRTPSPSSSGSPSFQPSKSATPSASVSASFSPSLSPSVSRSPSTTPSPSMVSSSPTASQSQSPSPSLSSSPSPVSPTPTLSPSRTPSPSRSPSPTKSSSPTPSKSGSPSRTPSPSQATKSPSRTPSFTPSGSPSPFSPSPTKSPSPSSSTTPSPTASPSLSPSSSPSSSSTPSPTASPSLSPSSSPSSSSTPSPTSSPSLSPSASMSPSSTPSPTSSPSLSPSPSPSSSSTPSASPSSSPSQTPSPSSSPSTSFSPSQTPLIPGTCLQDFSGEYRVSGSFQEGANETLLFSKIQESFRKIVPSGVSLFVYGRNFRKTKNSVSFAFAVYFNNSAVREVISSRVFVVSFNALSDVFQSNNSESAILSTVFSNNYCSTSSGGGLTPGQTAGIVIGVVVGVIVGVVALLGLIALGMLIVRLMNKAPAPEQLASQNKAFSENAATDNAMFNSPTKSVENELYTL
uniref:Transmembrane domain containing protein n=1 Tax=Marseillevirus sp. TaxID=2809551 RepID=A0AA96EPD7_9VIRU|nr:transmembrane domain containing protein [Marseillevirus sp.]